MSRYCFYDDDPPDDFYCSRCKDTQFSIYIQNGEDGSDCVQYRTNPKPRRNPNVVYGYGHRAEKNPYFNDMDPVEGGNYK